jgi:hypothetical protein
VLCREVLLASVAGDSGLAITLRCRSWNCDACKPDRVKRCFAEMVAGRPTTFITLTVRAGKFRSANEAAHGLVVAWRQVRRRAITTFKLKELEFYAVFEATKAGWPHLHILARCDWIPQKWLSDQMKARLDSPVVDIRVVGSHDKGAQYLAKYLGKAHMQFGTCKRYWHSRNWLPSGWSYKKAERQADRKWHVLNTTLEALGRRLTSLGIQYRYDGDSAIVWSSGYGIDWETFLE